YECKAAKHNDPSLRKLENDRSQQHMARLRQDLYYVGMSNLLQNK
ncbi:13960_t:CDS:1, partial [Gigaspora margarita]